MQCCNGFRRFYCSTFLLILANILAIEQLMISIYQMIDEGNDSPYLMQFETIFSKLRDELYASIIEKRNKELGNMSLFPLLGSSLLIIMISFGVMEVIGGMISGL